MTPFLKKLIARARSIPKTVVLPESSDKRILGALPTLVEQNIAKPVLIGNVDRIAEDLKAMGLSLDQVPAVDPCKGEAAEEYAQVFYEIRKYRGVTLEKARQLMADPVYFGTMMVKQGDADGLIAGACHSTADTIRPALQVIKAAVGFKTVSSMFFMCMPDGEIFIFADCALVQNPTSAQMADIAISTAITAHQFGIDPKIAMLSYSTKSSSNSRDAYKVAKATDRARDIASALFGYGGAVVIDGELQFDAAFVPEVAALKCPDSPLKGKAKIFIFPDLSSGNITYNAVQRMAKAEAYGPVLQGLAKPVNDLSRGCSIEDVIATAAITAIQAQG
ncbi:MAG: phosphate acetyltransferase [Anaerohalosphaera sp.]|nr:phosphate acetyltransferase [Anaerohalosphaera sp.]